MRPASGAYIHVYYEAWYLHLHTEQSTADPNAHRGKQKNYLQNRNEVLGPLGLQALRQNVRPEPMKIVESPNCRDDLIPSPPEYPWGCGNA